MENQELFVPSVHSSLEILEWLSKEEHKYSTLTDLSNNLHISKSTCLRILKTLTAKGYLSYNPDSKNYSLGFSLIPLGIRSQEINDRIGRAIAYLPQVAEDTGITAVLVKRIDQRLMYIGKQEPLQKIRLTVTVGETFPIHVGALGKCFLAYLDTATREALLSEYTTNGTLPTYTDHSLTRLDQLLEQIDQIRREGVAQSNGEYNIGINAVACPIFDERKKIILALGGFTLNPIQDKDKWEEMKKKMIRHAHKISELIF
ncbi:IclR family transcriptional regulator [Sporolactobacillus laevolacticus]|uniref:IclR family transcriptional regulator n=1 Tax=Sporolactobacillus laevolacticus TaxID=33018 RepID=UPI0025B3B5AD|nr:IclR family transcriptional regulator [Sporolactobacillus laevolacticus]MDN3954478.1 IclR family transcriptional regulator [Sporolactobacillus laevolacticus]